MKISGWNRYPVIDTTPVYAFSHTQLQSLVTHGFKGIARGMGRSYGDSSLADSVIDLTTLDYLLDFDHMTGRLRCCAGVTLNDLLNIIVSRGWFMPVTPGTKYVTVGGAIASDGSVMIWEKADILNNATGKPLLKGLVEIRITSGDRAKQ